MERPYQDSGDKEEDSIVRDTIKREDLDLSLPDALLPREAEDCERT